MVFNRWQNGSRKGKEVYAAGNITVC